MGTMRWCLGMILLVGCGGDGSGVDGGVRDSGTSDHADAADGMVPIDAMALDAMAADAMAIDAMAADAGPAPGDAGPALPGDLLFRFAHMEPTELPERVDVCMTATSGPSTGTTLRMYEGTTGIGRYEVGAWRALDHGEWTLALIAPSDTCGGDALYSTSVTQDSLSGPVRTTYTLFHVGIGQQGVAAVDRVFPGDADENDRIRFQPAIADDPTTLVFADATGSVPLGSPPGAYGLVEGGRSGTLTLTFLDGTPAAITRAYVALAGGHTTIFARGTGATTGLTVCDDFAAPIGHLGDCRESVRAP